MSLADMAVLNSHATYLVQFADTGRLAGNSYCVLRLFIPMAASTPAKTGILYLVPSFGWTLLPTLNSRLQLG